MTTEKSLPSTRRARRPATPRRKPSHRSLVHILAPLTYAAHKLTGAVAYLATSDAPIRDRLRRASAMIGPVGEDDFPEGSTTRAALRAWHARTSWAESKGAGTLPATLALVSDQEAHALARLLVDVASGAQSDLELHLRQALHWAERRATALKARTITQGRPS